MLFSVNLDHFCKFLFFNFYTLINSPTCQTKSFVSVYQKLESGRMIWTLRTLRNIRKVYKLHRKRP